MSWISNTLLSVVMSKDAREKMKAQHAAVRAAEKMLGGQGRPEPKPPQAPETAYEALDRADRAIEKNKANRTPERDALIKNAMNIHKNKQDVLKDLSQDEREKLMVLALKLMGGGKG